jgi:hypothetical protein
MTQILHLKVKNLRHFYITEVMFTIASGRAGFPNDQFSVLKIRKDMT